MPPVQPSRTSPAVSGPDPAGSPGPIGWLRRLLTRDSVRVSISVGGPILALVLVIGLLAFQLLGSIAQHQDSQYASNTRSLVRKAIDAKQAMNANVALDYGNWTDAWLATRDRLDRSFLDANFQTMVTSGIAVFRPGVGPRHIHVGDETPGVAEGFERLMRGWARTPEDSTFPVVQGAIRPIDSYIVIDGTLAAISIRPIQPEEGSDLQLPASGPTDWAVALRMLNASKLGELANSLGVDRLDFVASTGDMPAAPRGTIGLPVFDSAGRQIGNMVWPQRLPGTEAFAERTWPIALILLAIGVLTMLVTSRTVIHQLDAQRAARSAAEDASRAKSAFLAGISHELRTPLNAIIGYAEILKEDSEAIENDLAAADAAKIARASRHLLSLINDLLDHSKIEAGKMDLFVEATALTPLVAEAADTVRPMVEANGSRFEVSIDPDLGAVPVDAMRLKQCLLNLLSNAAKFTHGGSVQLFARRVILPGASRIRLEVSDTGIGMSPDAVSRLFSPFVQADSSTAARFGGTGLGLSITRALVEAMGGSISVASTEGAGSTFTILLPCPDAAAAPLPDSTALAA